MSITDEQIEELARLHEKMTAIASESPRNTAAYSIVRAKLESAALEILPALLERVRAQQAEIEKLPRYADTGKIIRPGSVVYGFWAGGRLIRFAAYRIVQSDERIWIEDSDRFVLDARDCYSTEAAAASKRAEGAESEGGNGH